MIQILLHFLGDYVLQSDWMALHKDKNSWRCFVHVFLYTLPFYLITHSPLALAFIMGTHFLIDRFKLARYLIYAKNHINPSLRYHEWRYCQGTGYYDNKHDPEGLDKNLRPLWITVWLYIITDNGLHVALNYVALTYL